MLLSSVRVGDDATIGETTQVRHPRNLGVRLIDRRSHSCGTPGLHCGQLRGEHMRRFFIAFVAAAAAIGATIGSADASGQIGWSVERTPNPSSASLHFGALDAVSCPTTTACV